MNSASSQHRDTQAVILAGGLGTRMRPITETIPKPMITVAGKPFLQHQLELLARSGIRRSLLLVAYLGEQIEQYFCEGAKFGWSIGYAFEKSPLGTGGALKNAEAQLQEDFVLVNGDTYLAIDYASLVAEFAKLSCLALIVAYSKPETPLSDVPASLLPNNLAVGKDGFVTAYRKREPAGLTHIDAGVVLLKKETLARLPASQKCSLEEEIYPQLIAERKMLAWITSEPFYDMGSPAGLAALEAKLA